MQAGLQSREPDHRDGFIHNLKAKVGDQAMQIELLAKKIEILEVGLRPPPRRPSLCARRCHPPRRSPTTSCVSAARGGSVRSAASAPRRAAC